MIQRLAVLLAMIGLSTPLAADPSALPADPPIEALIALTDQAWADETVFEAAVRSTVDVHRTDLRGAGDLPDGLTDPLYWWVAALIHVPDEAFYASLNFR